MTRTPKIGETWLRSPYNDRVKVVALHGKCAWVTSGLYIDAFTVYACNLVPPTPVAIRWTNVYRTILAGSWVTREQAEEAANHHRTHVLVQFDDGSAILEDVRKVQDGAR